MNKKAIIIIFLTVFLIGAAIFIYPTVNNALYEKSVEKSISNYQNNFESKQSNELYEYMKAYNESLYENSQKTLCDPFSYQQTPIDLSQYGITDGIVGYILIDKMDVSLPIYLGASKQNMQKGAAQLTETSYPVGGQNTNCVIAAHRGHKLTLFRNIQLLETGDSVVIKNFKETLNYQVIKTEIIEPDNVDKLFIQNGKDMVTLITCHPYRVNSQRYVVYCERIAQ